MDQPLAILADQPGWILFAVFGAAVLEHVFPPFWGDTLMLAGCFLAGLGHVGVPAVYLAALTGSCLGATSAFWIGRRLGEASLRFVAPGGRAGRLLDRARALQARHGARVLAVNRFLPGIRAVLLPLAGASGVSARAAIGWSSLSNVLYCGLLVGVGLAVAGGGADFAAAEGRFRIVFLTAAGLATTVLVAAGLRGLAARRRCSRAS